MTRKQRGAWAIGALLMAVALTAAPQAQAGSAPDNDRPAATRKADDRRPTTAVKLTAGASFWIRNKANSDCLYIKGAWPQYAYADGYCGDASDEWYLDENTDGSYSVMNFVSGACLFAEGTTNNSYVRTYTCGSYQDQKWDPLVDSDGIHFRLKNRKSGLCLVHRFADYGPAQQYRCDVYQDQRWALWG